MFFDTLTTSVPMYRVDRVRILAVGSRERSPAVPEIPTVAESGLPGFQSITWFALVAPPDTPTDIVEKINRDVADSLQRPEVGDKLQKLMLEPMFGSPADTKQFFIDETELWGKVIKQSNVVAE